MQIIQDISEFTSFPCSIAFGDDMITFYEANIDDAEQLAGFLKDSFLHAESYKDLSDTERSGYITLNTPEKTAQKTQKDNKVCFFYVTNSEHTILGCNFSELEYYNFENQDIQVAATKRLHVHNIPVSAGLGHIIVKVAEIIAKQKNIAYCSVVPSNPNIEILFTKEGYSKVGNHTTDSLQQVGIQKTVPYMLKML